MLKLRFIDRIKYVIERQFVKGAAYQLLIVMLFIGLISLLGGLLVAPAGDAFEGLGSAIWWAFLRLTDPGYLGDDEGTWMRFVSTLLTVSGYVVFLGALVAIMTRKLIEIMGNLERGLTPVALKHHIVVLGWNSHTLPLLRELLGSTHRMKRFLERSSTRRLNLVVLSQQASSLQRLALKNDPGIGHRARNVILRSGLAIQPDALKRVACLEAAAVIIPSGTQGPDSLVTSDVETIKALLSIAAEAHEKSQPLPYVVAQLQDIRKRSVLERAYPGAVEVVAGDATISRLLAQNLMHPGLSDVYNELLSSHNGNNIYVRSGQIMAGRTLQTLASQCPRAIVLGLLRPAEKGWQVMLLADSATTVRDSDRVILMARDYNDTQPSERSAGRLPAIQRPAPATARPDAGQRHHRVLILGWNRRMPSLMADFASYRQRRFTVEMVSVLPAARREAEIAGYTQLPRDLECRHIEADYMVEGELRRLNPHSYDSIVLLSSDRLVTGEEADARAMVGHLLLDDILSQQDRRPQRIMELSDPDNENLLTLPHSEVMISPVILSHVLAQVALRRELRVVFDELFTAGGAEILFRDPAGYPLPEGGDFLALQQQAALSGEIALGICRSDSSSGPRLQLNPPNGQPLSLAEGDQLVMLAHTG
ncbi:MAG: hypothetical protein R3296_13630 [Oleiphilaceae bacterium]|nr:hypothetical protein [Oleiphilaceae bacterium]